MAQAIATKLAPTEGKNNNQYTFAFVINNNYDGNDNEVRRRMWRLLGEFQD